MVRKAIAANVVGKTYGRVTHQADLRSGAEAQQVRRRGQKSERKRRRERGVRVKEKDEARPGRSEKLCKPPRTGPSGTRAFLTQVRPFPDAEVPSGRQLRFEHD